MFRSAVGVLLAALATACLGGQTGQPSSITVECDATGLSPTAAWSGTSVQAAARAFDGTHTAVLAWQVEPRSSLEHTPVDLQDSVQLTLAYQQVDAKQNCPNQLIVPVLLTLTSSASGISETGEATLTIGGTLPGLIANLDYQGKLVRLAATLHEAASGDTPLGGFDALDPNLPGASASFTEGP